MNTLAGYRSNIDELFEEHVMLVEAVLAGDGEKAGQIAKCHNTTDGEFLIQQLTGRSNW